MTTKLTPREVLDRLKEQVDSPPSILDCLKSFNASYWSGNSAVCGNIRDDSFMLRNRQGPGFSLEALGVLHQQETTTLIEISFREPLLYGLYKWARGDDRAVILAFLESVLRASITTRGVVTGSKHPRPTTTDEVLDILSHLVLAIEESELAQTRIIALLRAPDLQRELVLQGIIHEMTTNNEDADLVDCFRAFSSATVFKACCKVLKDHGYIRSVHVGGILSAKK